MQTRVLFIADKLATDARAAGLPHAGGAELTDLAAIEACPWPIVVKRLRDVDVHELARFDVIIVGNSTGLSPALLHGISATRRHILFEHDLRICRWRGDYIEARGPAHRFAHHCLCPGGSMRALVESARGVIYLTGLQRQAYLDNPHCPAPRCEAVLGSSLFSDAVLDTIGELRNDGDIRSHSAIAWSPCPIKGHALALQHCRRNGLPVREIRRLPYLEVLRLLSRSERFVYLPLGLEPAGRMPVEARLLGCEVVVNGNVGVAQEPLWQSSGDVALTALRDGPRRFWRLVEAACDERASTTVAGRAQSLPEACLAVCQELASVRRRRLAAHHWLASGVARRIEALTTVAPWPSPRGH